MAKKQQYFIRPMVAEDAETYRDLRIEMVERYPHAFRINPTLLKKINTKHLERDITETRIGYIHTMYMAQNENGDAVGMAACMVKESVGEVSSLYVRKEHQYNRVGTMLLRKCISFAVDNRAQTCALWVAAENTQAYEWYLRSGFVVSTDTVSPFIAQFRPYDIYLARKLEGMYEDTVRTVEPALEGSI